MNKMIKTILMEIHTLSGEATMLNAFYILSGKGSTLKVNNLLREGSKFFPFRIGPFAEGG